MGAVLKKKESNQQDANTKSVLLIADDHPVTLEIERNYFAGVGFSIHIATQVAELFQILRAYPVDLLMITAEFAKGRGLAELKKLKADSINKDVKILVMSVQGASAFRSKCLKAGADEFLVKPAPRQKILSEIKKLTSQAARNSERVAHDVKVECHVDKMNWQTHSLDVSSEGIHLSKTTKKGLDLEVPKLGSNIALELFLEEGQKPLKLEGKVVRHTEEGLGVRFDEMSTASKRQLDKFLLKHSLEYRAIQYYL